MSRLSRAVAVAVLIISAVVAGAMLQLSRLGPVDGDGLRPDDMDRVSVGTTAPDFTLASADGRRVTLSSFRGSKFVVLVFYRGHW